jgi:hypothetical protein
MDTLTLPIRIAAAVSAAVRDVLDADPPQAQPGAASPWPTLAPEAVVGLTPLETRLLQRLAEARGQRVPLAELSRDFGLPAAPALDQDFPRLTAFCAASPRERPFPIVAGGSGESAWYWMPFPHAIAFVGAFQKRRRQLEAAGRDE